MESTLFVPAKLTFSENLRCLNLPLLVGAVSQKRSLSKTCFVFAGQIVHSGKFKHIKYSENIKLSGTNSIDSILGKYLFLMGDFWFLIWHTLNYDYCSKLEVHFVEVTTPRCRFARTITLIVSVTSEVTSANLTYYQQGQMWEASLLSSLSPYD